MKKYIIFLCFAVLLVGVGFYMWRTYMMPSLQDRDTVELRPDLPRAPLGYDTLKQNPELEAQMRDDFRETYLKEFDDVLVKIKEHPDSFLAWMNLGFIKNTFGDYDGAEKAWLYATEISPDQYRSLMNLADLYANTLKDYPKAEQMYLRAIQKDVTYIPAYRDLATLYHFLLTEKKDNADTMLWAGFRQNNGEGVELLALGASWAMQEGRNQDAIAFYEEYLKHEPNDVVAQNDLKELRSRIK